MLTKIVVASCGALGLAQDVFLGMPGTDRALLSKRADFPMPAIQTSAQKDAFAIKEAAAQIASEAATPDVLAFFESYEFRQSLNKCCSAIASLTSLELLEAFRKEAFSAELCHHVGGSKDMTVAIGMQYPWFLNIDQCGMVKQGTSTSLEAESQVAVVDDVEEVIFGVPAYADSTHKTWEEAGSRLIYTAHNLRQVDMGSPIKGQASAVFSTEYTKDMVVIAGMDTGMYSRTCSLHLEGGPHPGIGQNCSAWSPPVAGTLRYHDHLILANLGLWAGADKNTVADQAAELFARSGFADGGYDSLPAFTGYGAKKYWEANILGNPRYPEGIRFLVVGFGAYFGTDDGKQFQQWADKYSWPLVWALGDPNAAPGTTQHGDYAGHDRFLDPSVIGSQNSNAAFSEDAASSFGALWAEVAASRASSIPDGAQFAQWYEDLKVSQVRLAPVTARACENPDQCVGIDLASNQCVC